MISPLSSKNSSRLHLRNLLEQTKPYQDPKIQDELCQNLQFFLQDQDGRWAGFQPLPQEPEWTEVRKKLPKIQWAFPKIQEQKLEFVVEPQSFSAGAFGVSEPHGGQVVDVSSCKGVLVPGLGFSKSGQRLGRGKGFYDRALQDFSGIKVGLCFSIQLLESDLPCESHDINVDHVVTELGVYDVPEGAI